MPRSPSRVINKMIAWSRLPHGLPRSTACRILVTSAGSHTDGLLACLVDFAAGTASSTASSTSPLSQAKRRNDRTGHSLCSTVLA